jgi:hypothetical protein
MSLRHAVAALLGLAVLGALLPSAAGSAPTASSASSARRADAPATIEQRVIGRSVRGRAIRAYRIGERGATPRVVLIATMHGDERATRQILLAMRDGRKVLGSDVWLIPDYNPDGLARGTRKNARGVDLNRNFPFRWADLDGPYESGPRPASEPETRAVMRFLRAVRPARILSFHQPLNGVDTDTKNRAFARRVADALNLPRKRFDCGGVCHGTMTGWYTATFAGAALTVEYGARPNRTHLRTTVPRQLMRLFGMSYGELDWQQAGS